ncbi:MAG: NAD(P) transhydrogenase subunit alpha [Bacteroidota bacterium]
MDDVLRFFFDNREGIFIIILSILLGIEVISHVPSVLHTPMMSGANAIHGVILIGALIVMGHADNTLTMVLGFIAVMLGMLNVVGGFVVTDRMLKLFRKKKTKN